MKWLAILITNSSYVWPAIKLIFESAFVICAATGIVLVSSILAHPDISYEDGGSLTRVAFAKIPYIGAPLLSNVAARETKKYLWDNRLDERSEE